MHVFHGQGNYLLRRAASGEVEHHCKPMRNMNHRLSNVTYRKVPIFDEDTAKKAVGVHFLVLIGSPKNHCTARFRFRSSSDRPER